MTFEEVDSELAECTTVNIKNMLILVYVGKHRCLICTIYTLKLNHRLVFWATIFLQNFLLYGRLVFLWDIVFLVLLVNVQKTGQLVSVVVVIY